MPEREATAALLTAHPYSTRNLEKLCREPAEGDDERQVSENGHILALDEYLVRIKARSVVKEHQYVDRDFLEDYAAYYARCFGHYGRYCQRLHFFSRKVDAGALDRFPFDDRTWKSLRASYLGFVVLKPLPHAFVGRTMLKPYDTKASSGRTRHFPALKEHDIHIRSRTFTVASIPFQEQDQAVAACATTAIWSALGAVNRLFETPLLSPSSITAAVAEVGRIAEPTAARGLTENDIATGITKAGLRSYIPVPANMDEYKELVRAYGNMGIAPVLSVMIRDDSGTIVEGGGGHAVVVSGYCSKPPKAQGDFWAHRITQFYLHDDNKVPFTKSLIVKAPPMRDDANHGGFDKWLKVEHPTLGSVLYEPWGLYFPLYEKIRVPYFAIKSTVRKFDLIFRRIVGKQWHDRVWDIVLDKSVTLQEDILADRAMSRAGRLRVASASMPRFVWRAKWQRRGRTLLEIVFDATESGLSFGVLNIIYHDAGIEDGFRRVVKPKLQELTDLGTRYSRWVPFMPS